MVTAAVKENAAREIPKRRPTAIAKRGMTHLSLFNRTYVPPLRMQLGSRLSELFLDMLAFGCRKKAPMSNYVGTELRQLGACCLSSLFCMPTTTKRNETTQQTRKPLKKTTLKKEFWKEYAY